MFSQTAERGVTSIRVFAGGPFGENTYLAFDENTRAGVLVDPGAVTPSALAEIDRLGVELEAVLLTHAHLDHIEGLAAVRKVSPAPIYLHPADQPFYDAVVDHAAVFGVTVERPPPPDESLKHGDTLTFAGADWEVRHAPGHAPGHVVFYSEAERTCFAGDVVFAGSIGRTDLPGGDFRTLMASIKREVLSLPDETRLLTGHGPETTVGVERRANPFLVPQYGGEMA